MRRHTRVWLEGIATIALFWGAWQQRHIIAKALETLQGADFALVSICLLLPWVLYVWSAYSYKLLARKPTIQLRDIALAQLAANGPGRVVPGGAGSLSFGTLFLHKQGLKIADALAVALTNNFLGLAVNILVVWYTLALHPGLLSALHLSRSHILGLVALIIIIASLLFFGRQLARVKRHSDDAGRALRRQGRYLWRHPSITGRLLLLMLAILLTNTTILFIAAHSVALPLPFASAIVAMSVGVGLGSIIPTPGGVGGVEAGLIATLYALGFDIELATSAALLFRFVTYLEPIPAGIAAYIYLRRQKKL